MFSKYPGVEEPGDMRWFQGQGFKLMDVDGLIITLDGDSPLDRKEAEAMQKEIVAEWEVHHRNPANHPARPSRSKGGP